MNHFGQRYQRKVAAYDRLLHGSFRMDTELIEILSRTLVSLFLASLIASGDVPGAVGAACITIIMGIDLAAAFEALKDSQTQDGRQSTFRDNE